MRGFEYASVLSAIENAIPTRKTIRARPMRASMNDAAADHARRPTARTRPLRARIELQARRNSQARFAHMPSA
jgi:hypothetical protein